MLKMLLIEEVKVLMPDDVDDVLYLSPIIVVVDVVIEYPSR